MNITELSVRRPVTVVMVYVILIVLAVMFIPKLGTALLPETTYPVITVQTTYSNAGPEIVDKNVTQKLVNQLGSVTGVKSITSTSSNGSSQVRLEFGYDVDLDEVTAEINTLITRFSRSLPDGCGTPSVMRYDAMRSGSSSFMRLSVKGDMPVDELKVVAEDIITPLLERIEGIASVDVQGGTTKTIYITVSRERLEAYGITTSQISQALSGRNVETSMGQLTQDGKDYEIITSNYYENLEEMRQTVITIKNGIPVRIDDVAEISEEYSTSNGGVYINGSQGIYISLSNESGTNDSTVAKAVKAAMDNINAQVPSGVTVAVMSDNTSMITSTLNQVYNSAYQGAILAMLIILLFLRNIRSSIIIGLSIPFSFIITLTVMSWMGLTVNMMTMAGLILGMGMVVDSSIVILENIYNHRVAGERSAIAAILGSKNMMNAIVASTLTTLCVFIPLIIYKAELEQLGQLFSDLVITVCVSLISSLFVAITLVPALCGSIWPIFSRTQKPLKFRVTRAIDTFLAKVEEKLEAGYVAGLKFVLNNRLIVLVMVFSLVAYTWTQYNGFGMNMSPRSSSDDQVTVSISMPVGTNNKVVQEYLFKFQDIVEEECEGAFESITVNTGRSNSGSLQILLPDITEQKMTPDQIKAKLTPHLTDWADVTVSFSSGRGFGGGNNAIDVELISTDSIAAQETAEEIIRLLQQLPQITNPASDFENGAPRFEVVINKELAATYGASISSIANEIKNALNGSTATTFYENGNQYSVKVRLDENDVTTNADLSGLTVSTQNGKMPLDIFISFEEGAAPQSVKRENNKRINHVTAGVATGTTTTEAAALVKEYLTANLIVPDGVEISFGGEARSIEKFNSTFVLVIGMAVLMVFAVMAAQFESLIDPFIIFFSIPLLIIGVVWIHQITGQAFTLYSMVGMVALVGVVVNNGIVLVDYTNQLVDKKMPVYEACLEAGRNRLRPILMSTLTTVLGMVPMAFFPGTGAEQMQPVCLTMVGGLISGSIMTLFVSPILYTILNKRREKRFDDPDSLLNQLIDYDKRQHEV